MPATAAINTPQRAGLITNLPLAAATIVFGGTIGAIDANGRIVPGSDTAGLRVLGRIEDTVNNSAGSAGDLSVNVQAGVFQWKNSGTNAVDPNDVGKICFVEDDITVAETTTNKVPAGRVIGVDNDGVWVDTRFASLAPVVVTPLAALTSTNGIFGAAADLTAAKAEGEKVGDDVRAVHATLTDLLAALAATGVIK